MTESEHPSPRSPFRVVGRKGRLSAIPPTDYLLHTADRFQASREAIRNWRFEWACYGLLPGNQMTMLCAPANLGKSSVAFHILQEACRQRQLEGYYWHADGSPGDAKTFGLDETPGLFYMVPDFGGTPSVSAMRDHLTEFLAILQETDCRPGLLSHQVHCFDAFSNFVEDVNNKVEVKVWFDALKALRGLGATVLLIHHPTKRKEDDAFIFDGVNNIRSELDTLIYLDPAGERGKWKDITVRVDKSRTSYEDRFVEALTLDMVDRSVLVGGRQADPEQRRLIDWLQAELRGVDYLSRAQAEELLRTEGASRDGARKVLDLGLAIGAWGEQRGDRNNERRFYHPDFL